MTEEEKEDKAQQKEVSTKPPAVVTPDAKGSRFMTGFQSMQSHCELSRSSVSSYCLCVQLRSLYSL